MAILWQQIVDAVETKFKTILIANGYYTNLGNNVYIWRPSSRVESNESPAIIIRDVGEVIDSEGVNSPKNKFDHLLQVECDIVAKGDDDLVRKCVTDVFKAIGADDTWGGLAITTILNNGLPEANQPNVQLMTEQDENVVTGAKLRFRILYRTNKYSES